MRCASSAPILPILRLYCLMSAAHQFGRASPRARFFIGRKRRGHISRDPHFCGRWETRAFGIFGLKADCNGPWINLSTSGPPVDFWAAQRAARPRLIKHRRGLNHWRRDARNLPAHWALSPREDNEGSDNAHNIRCGDRPRPCGEWCAGTKSAGQRRTK